MKHDDNSPSSTFEPIPSGRALVPLKPEHDEFVSAFATAPPPAKPRPRRAFKPLLLAAAVTLGVGAVFLPDSPLGQILRDLRNETTANPTSATLPPRYNPFTHEGTSELLRYSGVSGSSRELMVSLEAHAVPSERLIAVNTIENEETRARLRWQFGQTLRQLASNQQMLENYYREHRDWPARDAGVAMAQSESPYIRDLELRGSGELVAALSADFGRNGQVRMTPEKPDTMGQFRWHCLTNVPISIEVATQTGAACRYNPYAF